MSRTRRTTPSAVRSRASPRSRRGPAARAGSATRRPPVRRSAPASLSAGRLLAVFVAFMVCFAAMGLRLVMLQTVSAPAYARLAADQRQRVVNFRARRGTIFDRRGEPLAISVDLKTVFADPALVENAARTARRLAPVLGGPPSELRAKLIGTRPGSRFEYLARQVEPEVADAVTGLDLPGVYTRREPKRFYPNGRIASQVLGFTDLDGVGTAGLELAYDGILQGRPGRMLLEQDPSGRPLPQAEFSYEPAQPGRDLFLTIDKELQYFTQLTLERALKAYSAEAATAVVMKPGSGEILAMASLPDFDLNRFTAASPDAMRNRAVTDMYEPGSVYKIVTLSAALEEDVVTPHTKFFVPPQLPYADRVFHDSSYHEPERMSVEEIIVESSNVGTIKMGLKLGGRLLDHYVREFGFGTPTGLGFPGEARGIVLPRGKWSGSTIATVPLGQGIAVTPLQMAGAFATIANDGVWIEPKLVYGTAGADRRVEAASPPTRRRVVSERTARQVTRLLAGVVARGTGLLARVPGYRVAGKTGTAQKPLPGGGYGSSYVASFGGYAPANDPQVVVLVTFDEPTPIWGGSTAAPTFKTIMEFALRELGVPPSGDAELAAAELQAEPPIAAHD